MADNKTGTRKPRAPKKPATLAHAEPLAEASTDHLKSNEPPLIEQHAMRIDDLYAEAENWLDGEPISNAEQAEQVTVLIANLETAAKEAEAARAAEKKPHWDAGKAVDAAWSPLKTKAETATRVAKKAMTPWLEAIAAENRRKADEAAKLAREAADRLREQHELARKSSDLGQEDVREALEAEAKDAAKLAARAVKETAVVRGGGKTVKLVDVWLVNITSRRDLLNHYIRLIPDDLEAWLYEMARKDVRAGVRHLPGCNIWSEKKAV